jgi:hypothetical protein
MDLEMDVMLLPPGSDVSKSLLLVPKVGSQIIAGYVKEYNEYLMESMGEPESIRLGGTKYSLLKGEDLIEQVKKLQDTVDLIINAIRNALVSTGAPDSGATFKANMISILATADSGNFSNLLNETVKHGE